MNQKHQVFVFSFFFQSNIQLRKLVHLWIMKSYILEKKTYQVIKLESQTFMVPKNMKENQALVKHDQLNVFKATMIFQEILKYEKKFKLNLFITKGFQNKIKNIL